MGVGPRLGGGVGLLSLPPPPSPSPSSSSPSSSSSSIFSQVATMQRVLHWDELLPPSTTRTVNKRNNHRSDDDEVTQILLQEVCLEQAVRLLSAPQPQLSEFASAATKTKSEAIKFYSTQDQKLVILLVPGLGQFGRMAYLPMTMEWNDDHNEEEEKSSNPLNYQDSQDGMVVASLVLRTLPGTFWEGQDIYIRIMQKDRPSQSEEPGSDAFVMLTQVALTSAGKSRTLPKALINKIVTSLAVSIQSSLQTRTQQAFVRLSQSARFKGRAKRAAQQKRNTRSSLERQLEEMAADRRRRRFQKNPDQGRYRPSGERMRSPNNAVY
mmetsp:Transcript_27031/g.74544  ORF Transcript_27031/g.74544 Transcript_27031/m.74544 type:complete len:324 (+) Transcript_27031:1246-2217(+)